MLLQLVVAEQSVVVVRRVIDDPAAKLGGGGADAKNGDKQNGQCFFSHGLAFLSSEIWWHGGIRVVVEREVARQIDFDPVPLADRDGRKNVQELVEDLRRGLRGALRETMPHEVTAGSGKSARSAAFGHGADRSDGE